MTSRAAPSPGDWLQNRHGPASWSAAEQAFILTRYADVAKLIRSRSVDAVEIHPGIEKIGRLSGRDYGSLALLLSGVLFFRNAPFHAAARGLIKEALAALADGFNEAAVAPIVEEAVSAMVADGRVDVAHSACARLPILVMARGLDLAEDTVEALHQDGCGLLDGWRRGMPLRIYDRLQVQAERLEARLRQDLAAARRSGEGRLARLMAVNDARFGLDDRALTACLFFLVLAGLETTAGLLGSAFYFLMVRPEEQERLRGDPALAAPFVEEVLRYAPPLRRAAARRLRADSRFGDVAVPQGSLVIAEIEDAQHDADAFAEPHRFIVGRDGPPLMAFGASDRSCLGGPLARLEGRLFVRSLLGAGADFRLIEPPQWDEHPSFRRLRSMKIEFTPTRRQPR